MENDDGHLDLVIAISRMGAVVRKKMYFVNVNYY